MLPQRRSTAVVVAFILGLASLAAAPAGANPPHDAAAGPFETAAKRSGTISGVVKLRGKPVKKAFIEVFDIKRRTAYLARTNTKGRYSAAVPPGRYRVMATHYERGGLATFAGNTVREPDAKIVRVKKGRTKKVRINLVPAATVTGKVVNAKGKPVRGATVWAANLKRWGLPESTRTDARGRYRIRDLAGGKIQVTAVTGDVEEFHARGTTKVKGVQGASRRAPKIRLVKPRLGTVTGTFTGMLPGDVVTAVSTTGKDAFPLEYAGRDGDSTAYSSRLPAGRYRLVVGGTNVASAEFRIRKGRATDAGTVDLPEERTTLTGRVVDPGGTPVEGAAVSVSDAYGTEVTTIDRDAELRSSTDADGRYAIQGLASGPVTVRVDRIGFAPTTKKIKTVTGATLTRDYRLGHGYAVSGRVKHRGKPVEGVHVFVSSSPRGVRTNAKGRFIFTNIPKGKHRVTVEDHHTGGFTYVRKSFKFSKDRTWKVTLK